MTPGRPDPVKNADTAADRPRATDDRIAGILVSGLMRLEAEGHTRARLVLEPEAFDLEIVGDERHLSGPGPLSGPLLVRLKELLSLPTGAVAGRSRGDLLAATPDGTTRWFRVHLDAAPKGVRAVIERVADELPLASLALSSPPEVDDALDEAERAPSVEARTAALARAGEIALEHANVSMHIDAVRAQADLALALGDATRARALLEDALAAADAANADALTRAALLLALVDTWPDEPERALGLAERAESIVEKSFGVDSLDRARMTWRVGGCLIAAGQRARGLERMLEAVAVSERAFGLTTAGDAYARVRLAGMRDASEVTRAIADARSAAITLDETCAGLESDVWERGHAQRTLGFLLWRAGRLVHARRAFEKACQIAQRLGPPADAAADASDLLAVILVENKDVETAERALQRAKKRAEALQGPSRVARDGFVAFAEGCVHEARGRREDARAAFERAAEHPALAVLASERAARLG